MPKGQKPYVPVSRKLKSLGRDLEDKGLINPRPQMKSIGEAYKQKLEAGMFTTASVPVKKRQERDPLSQRFKSRKV